MKKAILLFLLSACQDSTTPEEMIAMRIEVTNLHVISKDTNGVDMSLVALEKLTRLYPSAKNINEANYLIDRRDSLITVAKRRLK